MRTARFRLLTALALWLAAGAVPATGATDRLGFKLDLVARRIFPPELVLGHQGEIGLTEGQRAAFVEAMQRTQSDLVPLQLEVTAAGETLVKLLDTPRVDEVRALELTDRILGLEAQIKRRHMALLLEIKNLLTPEQQQKLRRIQRQRWQARRE